ncbi:hypothetical protein P280DRAFT_176420 [Massarina eburnea CBS 473.64]|uniref:Protein kinase domain-containing protein n=1 Tax=Massarina eburnea CBS 473.64 TaxID=1395130 RepID=A0A6A6SA74_9PLEO|nr:hypothetical protein P280DRAFT_176420 [Massarina eburnea CBS 473.64]
MAALQQFKNFLRHGKQARAEPPHGDPTTTVSNVHAQPHVGISEPALGHQPLQGHQEKNFSAAAVDNRNIAAQAGDVAARHAGDKQKAHAKERKDIDPSVLERIVAEEREAKGKLPKYPGLERWTLLEKMGDGAFSNVYRAKDSTGQYGEVAIKVVRKFEMNSSQVSGPGGSAFSARSFPFFMSSSPPASLGEGVFFFLPVTNT